MTLEEWEKCYETIERVFTGGDDSGDEGGERVGKYLTLGKGDVMFANSRRK